MASGKVDCIVDHGLTPVPSCEHGPCLLFERYKKSGSSRFFACSVYRNKKDCSFHLDLDSLKKHKPIEKDDKLPPQDNKLFKTLQAKPSEQRAYCYNCECLVDVADKRAHTGHELLVGIDDKVIKRPTNIIKAIINPEKESQYWFSPNTTEFLVSTVKTLQFDAVLCIGSPKLFEGLKKYRKSVKTFLLDFDARFAQFFSKKEFARYNMFVHHFFDVQGRVEFENFLKNSTNLLIFVDPPFGGMVAPLINTLNQIKSEHSNLRTEGNERSSKIMLVHPYFMEKTIENFDKTLTMLDYMVEYENHPEYKLSKCKNGSPVRIFTDIAQNLVKLSPIGYRLCKKCDRYVYNSNKHCKTCDACTSKDGRTYVHCSHCTRCVKPTYMHCYKCNQCHNKEARCPTKGKCHICESDGHKRNDCPKRKANEDIEIVFSGEKISQKGNKKKVKVEGEEH